MHRRSIAALVLISASVGAWAGDAATFVDLGFSADGTRYMFAQYGVESRGFAPWAELYLVDVPRNEFVAGGKRKFVQSDPVLPGQDGSGAFHKLLADSASLAAAHKVDALRQGTPLYVAVNGSEPEGGASRIEFRDFEAGSSYKATLVPYVEGKGEAVRSSFYIDVERTLKDGSTKRYTVGTPALKREGVAGYRIVRAVAAPRDGSVVFVVEMRKAGKSGVDLRYMVEAFRL